jgi:hypothetical protein
MITRLWEWLNRSLYVSGNWEMDSWTDTVVQAPDYQSKVDNLKNQMGPLWLCHSSNKVHRKDGKVYGSEKRTLKLRKV